eukprot:g21370.t1
MAALRARKRRSTFRGRKSTSALEETPEDSARHFPVLPFATEELFDGQDRRGLLRHSKKHAFKAGGLAVAHSAAQDSAGPAAEGQPLQRVPLHHRPLRLLRLLHTPAERAQLSGFATRGRRCASGRSTKMVSPAMLKGMNTEVYGEGHPFGDPSWYQAYNTPYYNDTHKQFRKLMREYVDEHIMSNVHDWDEKGTIPKEQRWSSTRHQDYFHELIMYDEMSRTGSVGFQWGIAGGTTIGLPPVYHHGSEERRNRVMPPCVKGEKVCCLAITEPTAGSDVANLKCTAKLEGDFYILNGEKKWITNGIFADYFTVACRTGKPGVGGISLLLVEKGMEGLECRTPVL